MGTLAKQMKYRLTAFGWHFLGSATALLLVLGTLYLGWYRWPGWYLTGVVRLLPILIGVDLALGPLVTLLLANPRKPARALARDIAMVVAVQLVALGYGTYTLWNGRPLYYAFSVNQLEVVQASDIDSKEAELGRRNNPALAPHWYSLPRWIYAPLPKDPAASKAIIESAIRGGNDVTDMPGYYQEWSRGLQDLRTQLKKVGDSTFFSRQDRIALAQKMTRRGLPADRANTIPLTSGRAIPLLAVFDPGTMQMRALLTAR
ncbi:MAG TPA: hypothetical protein VHB68_04950 [Steroidobacteraceae bacterium]|nr:hypothetical protein [Steroidobacteraceae bacterium]